MTGHAGLMANLADLDTKTLKSASSFIVKKVARKVLEEYELKEVLGKFCGAHRTRQHLYTNI